MEIKENEWEYFDEIANFADRNFGRKLLDLFDYVRQQSSLRRAARNRATPIVILGPNNEETECIHRHFDQPLDIAPRVLVLPRWEELGKFGRAVRLSGREARYFRVITIGACPKLYEICANNLQNYSKMILKYHLSYKI